MKNKILIIFFLIAFLLFASSFTTIFSLSDFPGLSEIKESELKETINYLASPALKGRLAGSPEYDKAASYMADEFKKLGLKPVGDSGYFQRLNVEYNEINCPCNLNLIADDKITKEFKLGEDYSFRGFTGTVNIKAPVVFCGYGISEPTHGYDDYKDIDVKGKIVILFKQMPSWKLDSLNFNGSLRYRSNIAAKHGAIATLYVPKPNDKNPQKPISSVLDGAGEQKVDFASLQISVATANDYFQGSGFTLLQQQLKIDSLKKPASLLLKTSAGIKVDADYTKEKRTVNILGMLEGSDPKLKNEYVYLTAHLDHVGHFGDVFYPGANDNASGSAGVLQIARAFVRSGAKPKRSIIFTLFSAEELGLNGASYCADHPPFPIEKTIALLNMDCIGYGDSIQVGNGKSSPKLWDIAYANDEKYTKLMIKATWNGGGADAGPFHSKGVPCLYFVTTNSYKFLHLPGDTPESLNYSLYQKVLQLAYITAYQIASGDYKREIVKP